MLPIDTARTFTIAGVGLTIYADADSRDLFELRFDDAQVVDWNVRLERILPTLSPLAAASDSAIGAGTAALTDFTSRRVHSTERPWP